ncbi:MAG: hypothetical protein A3A33_02300 [Candidatus Yanofskybacteria bacterium RIFCSPLOWO2_01_FULL_49_25]|uniref:Phosphoribulokinase/uridine kinase domain-containing protein n=1 Tax=Candidatus Yanofskybacteria bacterium RIFCSPLOWO2_01_FULL_49_25 TaxID=1802701 RepID=A0A1F8GS14_9BACT|nr:MAG: hypothetical protein A3A33_02300 [Candidatus Yanofskybacteria bacterium RIFCSPLOWO2_01_FULL_49_25]
MNSKLIAIAGGTGAGKSTLCMALQDKYPDQVGLIQLDDYFKPPAEKPKLDGMENSDHPDALYLDKLARDLVDLKEGRSVVVNTKSERSNPNYKETGKRIPITVLPKPIILVEGFLVLWDERIRKLLEFSIYLDVAHDTRWERRVHFKMPGYEENVLIPMHNQYVEPTKQYANMVIDVSSMQSRNVSSQVEDLLRQQGLLSR